MSTKNIKTERPLQKLDYKQIGLFIVLQQYGSALYKLDLLASIKIYLVFYALLLRLDPDNLLPNQIAPVLLPVIVNNEEAWQVEKVLDSCYHYGRLSYRVAWGGHLPDPTWYPAENFDDAAELIQEFHTAYPRKPKPRPNGIRSTRRSAT